MKKQKPKVKEKKKDEENFDYMKTNKDNIKNVIRNENLLPLINDITIRTNKIVIHSYQFLKLYLLYLYENKQPFPVLDKEYICDIFKVITKRKCNSGGYTDETMPDQLRTLTEFYKNHYSLTIANNEIKKCNYCKSKNDRCLTCRLKISKLGKDMRIKNLVSGLEQQPHQPTE